MGILSSLYTGASGLTAFGNALSVIGNNIANTNTVGYKSSTAVFADLVADSLGSGVSVSEVQGNFKQGTASTTGNTLDLAIEGNGFFQVKASNGLSFYTRDGQFQKDQNGNIVDPNGYLLQGYQADANGAISGTLGNLSVATAASVPKLTSTATLRANLNAGDTVPALAFSSTDPTTYNFSTSLNIYDSQGAAHSVSLYFVKTNTAGTWNLYSQVDGGTATAATNLVFDNTGTLTSGGTQLLNLPITGGGATPQPVTFDLTTLTQYGAPSAVNAQSQNGYAAGTLGGIAINSDGIVSGTFTNGQTRALGQVALSLFDSPVGLTRMGQNLFVESAASGAPITGKPNSGGGGGVRSGSLELSNVDLGQEFVDLISTQRGFQANSRVVTTSDELLAELLNMKR